MPYVWKPSACPCGSGLELLSCHGEIDAGRYFKERAEAFVAAIYEPQDEQFLQNYFGSPSYVAEKSAFETLSLAMQRMRGANPNGWMSVSVGSESVKKEDAPPRTLNLFVPSDLVLEDGSIGAGYLNASVTRYGIDNGNLWWEYRIKTLRNESIIVDGRPEGFDGIVVDKSFVIGMLGQKKAVLRSVSLCNSEVLMHSAA